MTLAPPAQRSPQTEKYCPLHFMVSDEVAFPVLLIFSDQEDDAPEDCVAFEIIVKGTRGASAFIQKWLHVQPANQSNMKSNFKKVRITDHGSPVQIDLAQVRLVSEDQNRSPLACLATPRRWVLQQTVVLQKNTLPFCIRRHNHICRSRAD